MLGLLETKINFSNHLFKKETTLFHTLSFEVKKDLPIHLTQPFLIKQNVLLFDLSFVRSILDIRL